MPLEGASLPRLLMDTDGRTAGEELQTRGPQLKTHHQVLGAGFTAAAVLLLPTVPPAIADSGLGQTRNCNYEAAPSQGCIAVEHWESDDKLFIQPLRLRHSWAKIKVYQDGKLIRVQIKRGGYGIFIPYRDGRYRVIAKTKNFDGYATAAKSFRITDA